MVNGIISQMTFYLTTPATQSWAGTFQVFLMEVDGTSINAYYGPSNATVVYEGALDATQYTMNIEFTDAYIYGGGNLLVGVYQTDHNNNYSSAAFVGETVSGASVQGYSGSNLGDVSVNQRNFIPKTTFTYTPVGGDTFCVQPTDIIVNNITSNSAIVNWTGEGALFKLKYKASNASEWVEVSGLSGLSYNITSLVANTAYDVWVQQVCEENVSGWKATSFTTPLGLPLFESFDVPNVIPVGWARYTGLLSNVLTGTALAPSTSGWNFDSRNGVFDNHAVVNIYGTGCSRWLVTPFIPMENNVILSFDLALTAYSGNIGAPGTNGDDDKFVVLITADGGASWNILRQWDNSGSEFVYNNISCSATGETVELDLSSYAGQNIAVAFYAESTVLNSDNNLHIDNVSIDYNDSVPPVISCPQPFGLAVNNITSTTAVLNWLGNDFATEWQVCLNGDTNNLINVSTTSYILNGLTEETQYNVKVRAVCSDEQSDWSDSIVFYTSPCSASEQCEIRLELSSSYGDGWNGNAISVEDALTGHIIGTYTLASESNANFNISVCDDRNINFIWTAGSYPGETSWDIYDPNGDLITSGTGLDVIDGATFFAHTVSCEIDNCHKPNNLTVNEVTPSSATINWNGTSESYTVKYKVASADSDFPVLFTDDFENGLDNWTTIDADGDGQNWNLRSVFGFNATPHNGSDMVVSMSYYNSQVLTPDNYLVSPRVPLGGYVRFYAAAQDASYPSEHFGIAVSTTGNTNASDFTTIQEWTMTAAKTMGSWFEYTVDLSAYAGQMGYVALRHFNCSDMFYLDVDDFTIYGMPSLDDEWTVVTTEQTAITINGLTPETNYHVQIIGTCDTNQSEPNTTSFMTMPCPEPIVIDTAVSVSALPLTWYGHTFMEFGTHTMTFSTTSGCDSTVILNVSLFINQMQIGYGDATKSFLPVNTYYNYSLTQQIYTSAEIGQAGDIYSVAFYNTSDPGDRNIDIYMVHTGKDAFSNNNDWTAVSFDNRVFSGSVTFKANEWTTIEFPIPFAYNGVDNLLIVVDDNTGTYDHSRYFSVFDAPNQAVRVYSDNTNYDPANCGAYTGTLQAVKNQIVIGFVPGEGNECRMPSEVDVADITSHSVVMDWMERGSATAWQISLNGDTNELINVTSHPYMLTGLTDETLYTARVRSDCGGSTSFWSDSISFVTGDYCMLTFELYDSYGDGWSGNKILVHNHGIAQEVTLADGHFGISTIPVLDGALELEWIDGDYKDECSVTLLGPCINYSTTSAPSGIFLSGNVDCEGGSPPVPSFTYWTENTCNSVIVHFENNSTNADSAFWNIEGYATGEWNPIYEFTESGTYSVALRVYNGDCELTWELTQFISVVMPNPITSTTYYEVCPSELPFSWHEHSITNAGTYTTVLESASGCDSTVTLIFTIAEPNVPKVSLSNVYFSQVASDERIVMITDYDNDNLQDLITRISPSGEIRFYRNSGTSMVYDYSIHAQPYAFSAAMDENNNGQAQNMSNLMDFDNDGVKDFLVHGANFYNCTSNSVRIYWGSTSYPYFDDNTYTELAISSPYCVGAYGTNLNNDGLADVLIRNCGPTNLYINNGNRTFIHTDVFNTGRDINVIMDDYDQDGNVDLCYTKNGWASGGWGIRFNRGNGDGTFDITTISNYYNERPLDGFLNFQADPLDDNVPDIAFTCTSDGTNNGRVYVGEWENSIGNFQFMTLDVVASEETRIVQAFDFNGDNYEDLIIRGKTGDKYSAMAYLNDGHGNFVSQVPVLSDSPYYLYKLWREGEQILMAAYHGTARDEIVVYGLNIVMCEADPIPYGDTLPCLGHETVTDYDGNVYNTVKIGGQCWMRENLRTTHYADGVEILVGNTPSFDTAHCYYPNGSLSNVPTYGYLYNWSAVMYGMASSDLNPSGVQGICPTGWHLPSDVEWTQLTEYVSSVPAYLCGEDTTRIAKALSAKGGWVVYSNDTNDCYVGSYDSLDNNITGFSAYPAGSYDPYNEVFYSNFGLQTSFWSVTEYSQTETWHRAIGNYETYVNRGYTGKDYALSVRCVLGDGCLPIHTEFYDTACGSYVWNDTVYTQTGDYTQTLINAKNCDSVVTLHLTVYPIPTAASLTANEVVCDGDSVELYANTYDIAPDDCLFTWYVNGVQLFESTTPYFTCQAYALENQLAINRYNVVVTQNFSGCVSEMSDTAVVVVNPNPIVTIGGNSPICDGGFTFITAIVTGDTENITYQWYKNGILLPAETSEVLFIDTLVYGSGDIYAVDAVRENTNCRGNATTPINSLVTVVPTYSVNVMGAGRVCEGDTLNMSLNVNGVLYGDSLSYQWYEIANEDTVAIIGATTPTCSISELLPGVEYEYFVTATSSIPGCSTATTPVSAGVVTTPTINISGTTGIGQGQNTVLTSSGAEIYRWYSHGAILGSGESVTVSPETTTTYLVRGGYAKSNLVVNGDFEQGNTGFSTAYNYVNDGYYGHYYIGHDNHEMWSWDDMTLSDHTTGSGLWMMVDSYNGRNVWSQTVKVTPNTEYIFSAWFQTDNISNVRFEINDSQGEVFTTPQQRGVWERRMFAWNSGNDTIANLRITSGYATSGGHDFGIDDIVFSEITCEATDSITVNVFVTPTVTTDTISNIGPYTATCGGDVITGGGTDVTDRGVCWSTSHNPTIADPHTIDGTGTGVFTSEITGLEPLTTYYVRAFATNIAGTEYGQEVSFTTMTDCIARVSVVSNNSNYGECTGSGCYDTGDTVTLHAIPTPNTVFLRWSDNDTANPRIVVVESDTTFTAVFEMYLPELHVTSISHSDFIGGETVSVSWTVQNDGLAPTPNGAVWYDRVWLSLENRVAADDNNPILLGEFPNVSALAPGEYYTQTQSLNIPLTMMGSYFLFVITDAYDAHHIYWDSVMQIPYDPPVYIGANSHHCRGGDCGNIAGNKVMEISEIGDYPYYHDNFFYELLDVAIPPLPDLKVNTIFPIAQNFFSGTNIDFAYRVVNDGAYDTRAPNWTDLVFVSNSPVFDENAQLVKSIPHHGLLMPDSSYQVSTTVTVPVVMQGGAWFYVYTDYYDQVYEHVGRYNNVTRSDSVFIILTPPADLVPRNITADNVVSTGATFHFSYEVHNQGAGVPNYGNWLDRCYLSTSADTLENAILMAEDWHYNSLAAGDFYSISHTVALPSSMTEGTYYLFVQTDVQNSVFEFNMEDNNLQRSGQPVSVVRPDLQIRTLNTDDTLHAAAEAGLSYYIANMSDGVVVDRTVTDRIYLSPNAAGTNATQIAELSHSLWLNPYDSIMKMQNMTIPGNLQDGDYYLFVSTNVTHSLNESDLTNNMSPVKKVHVLHLALPDLVVSSVEIPDTVATGDTVTIGVLLHNQGEVAVNIGNLSWQLSLSAGGQNLACVVGGADSGTESLAAGATAVVQVTALIPPRTSLDSAMLELTVNHTHSVTESSYSNNSYAFSRVVRAYPFDLAVTQFTLPQTTVAGNSVTVSWTVENIGEAPSGSWPMFLRNGSSYQPVQGDHLPAPWYDRVYLSVDSLFDNTDFEMGSYANSYTLNAGTAYSANMNCEIPLSASGDYYVLLVNDATSVTFDFQRANNVRIQPISVISSALPDLRIDTLLASDSVITLEPCQIRYTVSNRGEHATHNNSWTDALYLNSQPTLEGAQQLGTKIHNGVLDINGAYTDSIQVTIPHIQGGNYYLIGYTDATNQTVEMDGGSNNLFYLPITVIPGDMPDLWIDTLEVSAVVTTGESYQIQYTVSNGGEYVTRTDRWTDAFYLNSAPTMQGAQHIGSKIHNGVLDVNSNYTDAVQVTIPNIAAGDYYLIGYADATNQVLEVDSDITNLFVVPVTVAHPLPCDLTVLSPDFPPSANIGEDVQVSWTLQNVGFNTAQGNIKEAVYLSTDSTWSSDDIMLGSVTYAVNLAADGQVQRAATLPLHGVPTGDYYVVVKTNILNALNENTYTNNKAVSLMTLHVDYPSLYIDQEEQRELNSGQTVYYKLEVGPEYEHQTLSCKLTSPVPNVSNGLYIAYAAAPSPSIFDFSATIPYVQEQEILIPSLEQGTYYIMATGQTSDNSMQNVTILATIINFEILSVDANSGSNTGSVTTQIIGAKFDTIMDFRLANGNGYLPAEKVFFNNSTESYVTFNLRDQDPGVYDVVAELPGGIITVKGESFVIEEGLPAELLSNIIAPASVRNGNTFTVTIEYGNNGSTDLNVSGFLLVSSNGFPIAFSTDSLDNNHTELTFETAEPNGNPDVIRPGYFATKTIFVRAIHTGSINLQLYPIRRQY